MDDADAESTYSTDSDGSSVIEDSTNMNSSYQIDSITHSAIDQIGNNISIDNFNLRGNFNVSGRSRHASRGSLANEDKQTLLDARMYLIERYSNKMNILTPICWCPTYRQDMNNVFTTLHMRATNAQFQFAGDSKIHFNDIFNQGVSVAQRKDQICIFIEGASGYGKTTLTCKMAYDWATLHDDNNNEKSYMDDFSLVIVIGLRKIRGLNFDFEDIIFEEVFPNTFKEPKKRKSLLRCMEKEREKILFIFDGYDELKGDANKTLIRKILDRKFLPHCTIVLTSMPICINEVLEYCDLRLKIVGYEFDDAKLYIDKHFAGKDVSGKHLLDAICEYDDNIYRQFSTCPLLLLLLCIFAEEKGGKLPSKMTDVLTELVQCIIKRTLGKNGKVVEDVFSDLDDTLCKYGLLSYSALLLNQNYLSVCDLKNVIKDEDKYDIGIFHQTSNTAVIKTNNVIEPIHVIFMKYLAAIYMKSIIDSEDIIQVLNSILCFPSSFQSTLLFLSGLLGDDAHKLFKILPQNCLIPTETTICNLLAESGASKDNVNTLINFLPKNELHIKDDGLTLWVCKKMINSADFSMQLIKVEIRGENVHQRYYKNFFDAVSESRQVTGIRVCLLVEDGFSNESAARVASFLTPIASSKSINRFEIAIYDVSENVIINLEVYDEIVKSLKSYISQSKRLKKISIKMELSGKQLQSIAESLSQSLSIREISFDCLCCAKSSFDDIIKFLNSSNCVKKFHLRHFQEIGNRRAFIRTLSVTSKTSDSSNDSVESETIIKRMVQILPDLNALDTLDLTNSISSSSDFQSLGSALTKGIKLKNLIIKDVTAFDYVWPIFSALMTNTNLGSLDLSSSFLTMHEEDIDRFLEMYSCQDKQLRLKRLTVKGWKYIFNNRSLFSRLRKTLKYFGDIGHLDISNSSFSFKFVLTSDMKKEIKAMKPHFKRITKLCMDNISVSFSNLDLHSANCFPFFNLYFCPQSIDASCNLGTNPISQYEFKHALKTLSKLSNNGLLNLKHWNISLKDPEKIYKRMKTCVGLNITGLDISNLKIVNSQNQSVIMDLISCFLSSLKSLNQLTISEDVLTPENCSKIIHGISNNFSHFDLSVTDLPREHVVQVDRELFPGCMLNLVTAVKKHKSDYIVNLRENIVSFNTTQSSFQFLLSSLILERFTKRS